MVAFRPKTDAAVWNQRHGVWDPNLH